MPLPRLRARGELVEIRAADLRFTADEAANYLNDVMALNLTAQDVATLDDRTEGWIAALQLAALSMQGRDDVAGFVADLAGDDRYVVDYLVEEVLQRESESVRAFLLDTSILDRLSAALCDAVIVQHSESAKSMLEALERRNLFLVPLDDRRRWYRYHHLFAEVLQTHLLDERPDFVPVLHTRASAWYAEYGEPPDAIRHALAAGVFDTAADLVERAAADTLRSHAAKLVEGAARGSAEQPPGAQRHSFRRGTPTPGHSFRTAASTRLRLACTMQNSDCADLARWCSSGLRSCRWHMPCTKKGLAPMPHVLLVPLDGSPTAAVALRLARTLATALDARRRLLRVVGEPGLIPEQQAAEVSQATAYLDALARGPAGTNLHVETSVRSGEPHQAILHEIAEQHVSLVVMTTRGRSGPVRAVLGSTASDVVARTPVPLVVLRADSQVPTQITTMLVPVDGSTAARSPWALQSDWRMAPARR